MGRTNFRCRWRVGFCWLFIEFFGAWLSRIPTLNMNQKTHPKRTIQASFRHGPKPWAQQRRSIACGGVKLTKMTLFPLSSAATSIILYNCAHHPSSYAFDGGGTGAIHAAGRPRPHGRGGALTLLLSSVVVVDNAPPMLSPPSLTMHH
jgi:hypothetical protein